MDTKIKQRYLLLCFLLIFFSKNFVGFIKSSFFSLKLELVFIYLDEFALKMRDQKCDKMAKKIKQEIIRNFL